MTDERRIVTDLEGCGCDLMKILSQHWHVGTEEHHEKLKSIQNIILDFSHIPPKLECGALPSSSLSTEVLKGQ
jgi:hypothetical protein